MQIKITIRSHNRTHIRMAKIKIVMIPTAPRKSEKLNLWYIAGRNVTDTAILEKIDRGFF